MCTFICGTLATQQCKESAELVCACKAAQQLPLCCSWWRQADAGDGVAADCEAKKERREMAHAAVLVQHASHCCSCPCRYKQGRRSGVRHIVVMGAVDGTTLQGVSFVVLLPARPLPQQLSARTTVSLCLCVACRCPGV